MMNRRPGLRPVVSNESADGRLRPGTRFPHKE